MQYSNIKLLTTLLWNHYISLWFTSLLRREEISIHPLGRSDAVFAVTTVTESTVAVVKTSSELPPVHSLITRLRGRKSLRSKTTSMSQTSPFFVIFKPRTSALVSPNHMYSPNTTKVSLSSSQMFFWNVTRLAKSYCHIIPCSHHLYADNLSDCFGMIIMYIDLFPQMKGRGKNTLLANICYVWGNAFFLIAWNGVTTRCIFRLIPRADMEKTHRSNCGEVVTDFRIQIKTRVCYNIRHSI